MTKTIHFKRVDEFHKSYGMPRGTVTMDQDFAKLTEKDARRIKLRADLTAEEYRELATAESPEEIMKESCDLVYVIVGMFVELGWDFDEGPNYTPPTLKDLL